MAEFYDVFYDKVKEITDEAFQANADAIKAGAKIVAKAVEDGGIIQAFGSGHSYACAVEISGRAGGLIPTKAIREPSGGMYEMIEGVGGQFVKQWDLRKGDALVLISNSGRNPLGIEMAMYAKSLGIPVIVATALDSSKGSSSRHSSGKLLYEFADVVLDNRSVFGDSAIEVEGMPEKVNGTSSIVTAFLLDAMILQSIKYMLDDGFEPPVFRSANIDGGPEFNDKLLQKYKDRLQRY